MIFSELYSVYYNAVAAVLREACAHPVSAEDLRRIVGREAFGESLLHIEPALREEKWQLLYPDGSTPLRHAPSMPLTFIQRRWLKAVSQDPRIRLFPGAEYDDPGVEPLFSPGDVEYFDRYSDGDPYGDEGYIRRFRLILEAVREGAPLEMDVVTHKGFHKHYVLIPEALEYSEKDDKFRLVGRGWRRRSVNLATVLRCERSRVMPGPLKEVPGRDEKRRAVLEVRDGHNAPERVLMHFADCEKQAEMTDGGCLRLTVAYNASDETEMVIRVLSFGPRVRAVGPAAFTEKIRERILKQKELNGI